MATKRDKFDLTPKQRKAAEMLMNPDYSGTVTGLCEELCVARSTLYRWMEKPEFTGYMEALADKYANSELGTVWKALIRRCSLGDVPAIKLYFDLRDRGGGLQSDEEVQIIDDVPTQ